MDFEQLLETIKGRRSVRIYKKDSVPMDKLKLLVEAARWAPSAGNSQPWEFVLVNDEAMVDALKSVSPGWLEEAPALIVMCINSRRETDWSYVDLGAAMQNILLCAPSLGLGCCPIGSFVVEAVSELLDLPKHVKPVLFITVGYPDENPPPTARLSSEELILKRAEK